MKNPSIKTLRNKTDKLLTPWICGKNKKCLLCSVPAQVAHHFIFKSTSSRLRYEEGNLIPLCHRHHCALHNDVSTYTAKIVEIKGMAWLKRIISMKNEIVKTDRYFYQENYNRIKGYE